MAVNVWRGRDVPPAPAGVVGLRHWTIEVDGREELGRVGERVSALGAPVDETDSGLMVRDPSGIAAFVVARGAAA